MRNTVRTIAIAFIVGAVVAIAPIARAQGTPPASTAAVDTAAFTTKAREVYQLLGAEKFTDLMAMFDENMAKAFPTKEKLAEAWAQVTGQTGVLKTIVSAEFIAGPQGLPSVIMVVTFEKGEFTAVAVFNNAGKLAGFAVRPKQ